MFKLIPKRAIVFYEADIDMQNDEGNPLEIPVMENNVILTHNLNDEGDIVSTDIPNITQISEFLKGNFMNVSKMVKNPFIKGSLNDKILAWKYSKEKLSLIWWTDECKIRLETSKGPLEYMFPKLVFIYNDGIQIYAIKKLENRDTQLYYFSLPHLNSGNLCLGNVADILEGIMRSNNDMEQIVMKMESAIFSAKFTHPFSKQALETNKKSIQKNKYSGRLKKAMKLHEKAKTIYD